MRYMPFPKMPEVGEKGTLKFKILVIFDGLSGVVKIEYRDYRTGMITKEIIILWPRRVIRVKNCSLYLIDCF